MACRVFLWMVTTFHVVIFEYHNIVFFFQHFLFCLRHEWIWMQLINNCDLLVKFSNCIHCCHSSVAHVLMSPSFRWFWYSSIHLASLISRELSTAVNSANVTLLCSCVLSLGSFWILHQHVFRCKHWPTWQVHVVHVLSCWGDDVGCIVSWCLALQRTHGQMPTQMPLVCPLTRKRYWCLVNPQHSACICTSDRNTLWGTRPTKTEKFMRTCLLFRQTKQLPLPFPVAPTGLH